MVHGTMTPPTEERCKITRSQDPGSQRGRARVQSCAARQTARIRNPNGPNSELVIRPRPNGGVTITQGPAHVLIGPGELAPVMDAMRQITETR
jgi:hypothetical protein